MAPSEIFRVARDVPLANWTDPEFWVSVEFPRAVDDVHSGIVLVVPDPVTPDADIVAHPHDDPPADHWRTWVSEQLVSRPRVEPVRVSPPFEVAPYTAPVTCPTV